METGASLVDPFLRRGKTPVSTETTNTVVKRSIGGKNVLYFEEESFSEIRRDAAGHIMAHWKQQDAESAGRGN